MKTTNFDVCWSCEARSSKPTASSQCLFSVWAPDFGAALAKAQAKLDKWYVLVSVALSENCIPSYVYNYGKGE